MIAKHFGATLVALSACVMSLAGPAWACGDKLVALGGGVGFDRIVVSRNPSNIMLLLEPGPGLTAANDKFSLAASLTLAGHEVTIAKSTDEMHALTLTVTWYCVTLVGVGYQQYALEVPGWLTDHL